MKNRLFQILLIAIVCFCSADLLAQGQAQYARISPIEDAIIGGAIGRLGYEKVITIDEIITDFGNDDDGSATPEYTSQEEGIVIEIPNGHFSTQSVNVYPNPARDQVNIPFEVFGDYTIRLYDLSGRMFLQEVALGTNFNTLYIGDVPEGMYLLHVESQAYSKTHKLKVSR